jgi:hypothetical protein
LPPSDVQGRHFDQEIIILCMRWYVTYKLSYRDLAAMMLERGVAVAPNTIFRWVKRDVPELERRWDPFSRPIGWSWRVDETYIGPIGTIGFFSIVASPVRTALPSASATTASGEASVARTPKNNEPSTKHGLSAERAVDARAKLAPELYDLLFPEAIPIHDAVDLARFLVQTTIGFVKFLRQPPQEGGWPDRDCGDHQARGLQVDRAEAFLCAGAQRVRLSG